MSDQQTSNDDQQITGLDPTSSNDNITPNDPPVEDTGRLDDDDDYEVTIKSNDDVNFSVLKSVAFQSKLVEAALSNKDDGEDNEITVDVNGTILEKIINYLKFSKNNPLKEVEKPIKTNDLKELIGEEHAKFIDDLPTEEIFDIITKANYMDIQQLVDISCAKIATLIKDKSTEEIRTVLNIENDFTPEEEQTIKEENKWISENS